MRQFSFKPENNYPVKLFSHWGEAVVFWICCSAIVILAIISIFRWSFLKSEVQNYKSASNEIRLCTEELNQLKKTVSQQQNEIFRLQKKIDVLEKK